MADEIWSPGFVGQLNLKFFNRIVERASDNAAYFYLPVSESAYVQRAQYDILNGLPEGVTLEPQDENLLHITLLMVDKLKDDQVNVFFEELNVILPMDFQVQVVSAGTFPGTVEEGVPLVLHVDPDPALIRLQSELYNVAVGFGFEISPFSAPERYKPHITLALDLKPEGVKIPKLEAPFAVPVNHFVMTRPGYEKVYTVWLPTFEKETGQVQRGGPGSGHFGHAGRPGEIGGSIPGELGMSQPLSSGHVVKDPGNPYWTNEKMFTYQDENIEHIAKLMGKVVPEGMNYRPGRWLGLHSEGMGDVWREMALRDESHIDWNYIEEKIARLEKDLSYERDRDWIFHGELSPDDEKRRQELIGLWSTLPFSQSFRLQTATFLNLALLKRDEDLTVRLMEEIRSLYPDAPRIEERGGTGSGHHGHEGRPGEVGGSLPSGQRAGKQVREGEAPYEKMGRSQVQNLLGQVAYGLQGDAEPYFLGVKGYKDPEAIKDKPYVYWSKLRPLGSWVRWPDDADVFNNDRMIWSKDPLPPDVIYKYELGVVNKKAQSSLLKTLYENENEAPGGEHKVWVFTREVVDKNGDLNYKGFVVNPSTESDEGPWRATTFDLLGFSGHSYYNSPEEAIAGQISPQQKYEIRGSLFESISQQESFQVGNQRSMLRQQRQGEGVDFQEMMEEVEEKFPWPEGTPGVGRTEPVRIEEEEDLDALTDTILDLMFGPKQVEKYAISRGVLLQLIRGEPVFLGPMQRLITLRDGPFQIFEDGDEIIRRIAAPEPLEFRPKPEPAPPIVEEKTTWWTETKSNIDAYLDGTIHIKLPGQATYEVIDPGKPVAQLRDRIAEVLRNFTNGLMDLVSRGGAGSGHHGHEGRPGEVGGSLPGQGAGAQAPTAQGPSRESEGGGGRVLAEGEQVYTEDPDVRQDKLEAAKQEASKAGSAFGSKLERLIWTINNPQLEITDVVDDDDFIEFEESLENESWDPSAYGILGSIPGEIRRIAGEDEEMFADWSRDELESRISSMIEDNNYEIESIAETFYADNPTWDAIRHALNLTPEQFGSMGNEEIHGVIYANAAEEYLRDEYDFDDDGIYMIRPTRGVDDRDDVVRMVNEALWDFHSETEEPLPNSELREIYGTGSGDGDSLMSNMDDSIHLWIGRTDEGEIVSGMYAKEVTLNDYDKRTIEKRVTSDNVTGFENMTDEDVQRAKDASYLYIDLLGSKRRGQGYGTEIMTNALAFAAERGMGIIGNPTTAAWSFYTEMGAKRLDNKGVFTPTDVEHAKIALEMFGVDPEDFEAVSKADYDIDFENNAMKIWNVIDLEDPAALMQRPTPQSTQDNASYWLAKMIDKAEARMGHREPKIVARVEGALRRIKIVRGGPGSGHHGHEGRPGEVGGSLPAGARVAEGQAPYIDPDKPALFSVGGKTHYGYSKLGIVCGADSRLRANRKAAPMCNITDPEQVSCLSCKKKLLKQIEKNPNVLEAGGQIKEGESPYPGTGTPQEAHAGDYAVTYKAPLDGYDEAEELKRVYSQGFGVDGKPITIGEWIEPRIVPGYRGKIDLERTDEGLYVFYHGTPKEGGAKAGLRAGSLMVMDEEGARHYASRDRDLDPEKDIDVFRLELKPSQFNGGIFPALAEDIEFDESMTERHYGPGSHPGTGTGQEEHAGKGGGRRKVGLTSARPGRPAGQVFKDMDEFASALAKIQGVKDPVVQPGLGGWEGGSEPTWVIEFSGDGEAERLIAETAKRFEQDGVLLLDPCKPPADCSPVTDWSFDDSMTPDERKTVEALLVQHGIGGWTWYKTEGRPRLSAVAVPQWGAESEAHLSAADSISQVFSSEGIGFDFEVAEVGVSVMNKEGENSYDEILSR